MPGQPPQPRPFPGTSRPALHEMLNERQIVLAEVETFYSVKGLICQEVKIIINVDMPSKRTSKYMKQKSTGLNGEYTILPQQLVKMIR